MRVLISEDQIRKRVDEVAAQIARAYAEEPLTIVGVLTGCLVFLADLIRRLDLPLKIALVQASSSRGRSTTAGDLHVQDELLPDLKGRHILLIDDILDTGKTLKLVSELILDLKPASLRTCVLLDKKARREVPIEADFVGFEIPDKFVVGYGLDFAERYRNLPGIGVLKPEKQTVGAWATG